MSWTIFHEVYFYALFLIAILNKKLGLAVLFANLALAALCTIFQCTAFPLTFIGSHFNLLFIFGMISAYCFRKFQNRKTQLLLYSCAAIFLAAAIE